MKKLIAVALSLLFITSLAMAGQNTNSSTTGNSNTAVKKKRGPVFRASKDQIKQAPDFDDAMTVHDDAYYDKYSSYYSPYSS